MNKKIISLILCLAMCLGITASFTGCSSSKDADAFVKYLGRCQALLQRGEYVDDGEFLDVATNYCDWGRCRKDPNG